MDGRSAVKGRKRAVTLTQDGIEVLRSSLMTVWRSSGRPGKFTREARAELLGLSIATSERLLMGEGVDRATILQAFRALDVPWDERYCSRPIEPVTANEQATPQKARQPVPRRVWGLLFWSMLASATLALGAAAVGARLALQASVAEQLAFNVALAKGTAAYQRGDYSRARKNVERALQSARSLKDASRLAEALRMAGDLALLEGAGEIAEKRIRAAIMIRQSLGDDDLLPALHEALGVVAIKTKRYEEARSELREALSGYERLGDRSGIAMACRGLGSLALAEGDAKRAESWFDRGLETLDGLNQVDMEADIRARRAMAWAELGRLDEARVVLFKCLAHWEQRHHARWMAETRQQLASVELARGMTDRAARLLLMSRATFQSLGDRLGLEETERLLLKCRTASTG